MELLIELEFLVAGTTAATVLTRAIFSEGCKSVAAGMNAMDLRRGINAAVDAVVAHLKSQAKMISTSEEIAQVSQSQDSINHKPSWTLTSTKLSNSIDKAVAYHFQVGTISANGDREIGDLLARAMAKVGKEGVITVSVSGTTLRSLYCILWFICATGRKRFTFKLDLTLF